MRTVILGFDSFDPSIFEHLSDAGRLPNLTKMRQAGGYAPLEVCSPPQTEVSWTSIATGVDPGGHGIFDFVHRDPATYAPYVSILPTRKTALGEQFVPPYTTKTFFEEAAELGYPALALWWPALFPARPNIPVTTIPGLGTPDIRGQLGVGTFFTTEEESKKKVRVVRLQAASKGVFTAELEGIKSQSRSGEKVISLPVRLEVKNETQAVLTIGDRLIDLTLGKWSPIIELRFKAGLFASIYAITQVILTDLNGKVSFYVSPLQIHPLHPIWQYTSSASFARKTWKESGPFLTLGWPQDTTALEDGCISDQQFLDLCQSIFDQRRRVLYAQLVNFEEGVLAVIFDCLDRVQHMFLRNQPEIVYEWYEKLDTFVGEVSQKLQAWDKDKYRFLILSDHGFRPFAYKANLNRWLEQNGYLVMKDGQSKDLPGVDWAKTRAYAVGLNSLYLNVQGREGQGILTAEGIEPLLDEIKDRLLEWKGPDGKKVVNRVLLKHEAFNGPYVRLGPDLVVGYAAGYRASSETGLGKIPEAVMEENHDHWGADHCIDSNIVPGVIFANRDLKNFPGVSFRDIPFLAIGKHLDQSHIKPPSQIGRQGQKDLEERLKGLGYL
jgi:predicted AlkP superfamily phosphohydrolase/phosphomutase